MKKTLKISEAVHARLLKVQGQLQGRDGTRRTLADTIDYLITDYESNKAR